MKLKNKLFFLFTVAVFILSNKIQGQTTLVLSYDAYLKNVIENNPLSKKANNVKRFGETQYQAAKGNFDPFLNATYDNKFFNNSNYYSVLSSGIKVPVFTAQNLKFGYEYGAGSNINPEQYTSKYGLPFVGIEVGLLQGLAIDYRRAEVLKAKEYVNYFSAEKNSQINSLLFEASINYFDWLFSLRQLSLNNFFLDLANQRLNSVKALTDIGERATIDTVEAATLYQTRLLDFQNAQIEIQKQTNELASFNWQTITTIMNNVYLPADSLETYFEKSKNSIVELLYQDSTNNPIIAKYNAFQNVLEIDKRIKRELIKPQLNVNYNLLSNNYTSYAPVYSANNYKWGVDLSFPLLFRKSKNDYKLSKLNAQNNTYELLNKNNELNFKLKTLKQTITLITQQLQIAKRSALYNKQLVDAEKLKFANGESSLFILNARENKWLEAELKLTEYKLKFIKTVLNVIYLKGNLNYEF